MTGYTVDCLVVCNNASGEPDAVLYEVDVTQDEYDMGVHLDKAGEMAAEDGYESPYLVFAEEEINRLRGLLV